MEARFGYLLADTALECISRKGRQGSGIRSQIHLITFCAEFSLRLGLRQLQAH